MNTQNTPTLTRPDAKPRNQTLDILKGIGIILMVVGHSGCPAADFIYLFHMALFFMASGYVWNDSKVQDIPSLLKSFWSRVLALWLPYTLANGLFTLMNNVFVTLHIYTPDKIMTGKQIAVALFKNLLFAGDTTMGGASWFLRTLFIVSIGNLVIRYIVTRVKHGNILFHCIIVLTFIGAEVINQTRWTFPMGTHTFFCGYAAFLMGMCLRRFRIMEKLQKYSLPILLAGLLILLILFRFDKIGMAIGNIGSLPFFIAASLSGWMMIWYLSSYIKGFFSKLLCYLSRKSIWIVLLHFLAFKPLILAYIAITGREITVLSSFPVYAVSGLWIGYTVIGVALPVFIAFCTECLSKHLPLPVKKYNNK